MIFLISGLVLGLKHALDADHLAAVAALLSETGSLKKAALYGAAWGVGHAFTLFVVGFAVLYFKRGVPENIASGFEFAIGGVLILLGLRVILRLRRPVSVGHKHIGKPFVVGIFHGLAGSAVLSLLALTTVDDPLLGLWFILIFGIGSIIGMFLVSALISVPFVLTKRIHVLNKTFSAAAGIISIVIGAITIYNNIPTNLRI